MRNAILTISLLALACAFAQPQPPPSFDAASIKPTAEAIGSSGWDTHPGSIVLRGQTLKGLIRSAYELKEDQVSGGPKWLDADRFDINARAVGPAGDPQLLMMLRSLRRGSVPAHVSSRREGGSRVGDGHFEDRIEDPARGRRLRFS